MIENLKLDNEQANFSIIKVLEDERNYNRYREFSPLSLTHEDTRMNAVACQLHIIECLNDKVRRIVSRVRDNLMSYSKSVIILMDRSLYAPMVFSKLLYDANNVSAFSYTFLRDKTIREADETMKEFNLKTIGLYYLDTPIRDCFKNIQERKRYYEIMRVTSRGFTLNHLYKMRLGYGDHLLWWKHAKGLNHIHNSRSNDPGSLQVCIETSFLEQQKLEG